ncbi:MAG: hypothetical protein ACI86H_002149 [bacterium]|jgi:hypothetical protein
MKKLIIIVFSFLFFLPYQVLLAQNKITDKKGGIEQTAKRKKTKQTADEGSTQKLFFRDLNLAQFEKMLPRIGASLGKLDNRVSSIGVAGFYFDPKLDLDFQRIAISQVYGHLLANNPNLKLVKCQECEQIETRIENGTVVISRGLTPERKKRLADKLQVQGFLNAAIYEKDRQLTFVMIGTDATSERIILSEVVTGLPVPETNFYHWYIGQMVLPITLQNGVSLDHTVVMTGMERTFRFADSWIFGGSLSIYSDTGINSKLGSQGTDSAGDTVSPLTITTGAMIDGTIIWELIDIRNKDFTVSPAFGVGQFLSTDFNFAVYGKIGLKVVIGQKLVFSAYSLGILNPGNISEATNSGDEDIQLATSGGYYITFGVQF